MQSTATVSQSSTTRADQRAVDLAREYQPALVQQMPSQFELGFRRQQKHADTLAPMAAASLHLNMRNPRIQLPLLRLSPFHMLNRYDVRRDGDALEIGGMSSVAQKSNAYRDQLKTHKGKHHP
jgi:hypothetical protein